MDADPTRLTSVRRKPRILKSPNTSVHSTRRSASPRKSQGTDGTISQSEWSKSDERTRPPASAHSSRRASCQTGDANVSRPVTPPTSDYIDWQTPQHSSSETCRQGCESPKWEEETYPPSASDIARLFPHIRRSDDRRSTYSAPDELPHSPPQPLAREEEMSYMTISSPIEGTLPGNMTLRTSTYPPTTTTTTLRRTRSTSIVPDNTFADEEEFNLFAQATSGLGFDEPFSAPLTASPTLTSSSTRQLPAAIAAPPQSSTGSLRHTTSDATTPVITQAIRQLEQLLGDSRHSPPQESQRHQGQQQPIRRPRPPPPPLSEHDQCAEALEAAAFEQEMARWEEEGYDPDHPEDELPDYAQSQAQAQVHQRIEAARRAQELQRRWQLSGSKRPN